MALLDILLGGGVTGVLGSVISLGADYFKSKQQEQAKVKEAEIQLKIQEFELEKVKLLNTQHIKEIELETAARAESLNSQSLIESFSSDKATYVDKLPGNQAPWITGLLAIVDFYRGLIRPTTTTAYTLVFLWLCYHMADIISKTLSVSVGETFLYLTVSVTLWWFGSRPISKKV